ncbi:MAG: hypothetical protein JNL95_02395 [Chitinophagales bacterium]|nr:hypothetical protein [Chitinophagales bacterium]
MKKIFGIVLMLLLASSSSFASKVYIVIDKAGYLQSLSVEKTRGSVEADLKYDANSQTWIMAITQQRESAQPTSVIIIKNVIILPPAVLKENNLTSGGLAIGSYKSKTDSSNALTIVINLICWKCTNS